jgi:hypothetical protein
MTMDIEITTCTEVTYLFHGKKPVALREAGIDGILNRRVLKWSSIK